METIENNLKKLTFDDLREWAGEKILERGKGHFRSVVRQAEWRVLLADLHKTHKAKRRLQEVLDGLSGAALA